MYLHCRKFKVYTDSTAAKHVLGTPSADAGGRIMRWSLALQDFDAEYIHRAGKKNGDADWLSRNPLESTEPYGEGETSVDPATMMPATPPAKNHSHVHFGSIDETAHNAEEFRKLQDTDPWCVRMAQTAMEPEDATEGRIYRDPDRCGLLTRKRLTTDRQDQVLVPDSLKAFILRRYHGLPLTGHTGRRKTYEHITLHYYWPGLRRDLRRWLKSCLTCRRRKTPRPMRAGNPGTVSNAIKPWETICIDIISATAVSKGGYAKILTILDAFTRYIMAIPLRHANAEEIGNALFREVFCRFGKPQRIHSDEGKEFVNDALTAMYERWGVNQTSTGGYQPQANPVERFHRFMNSSMTMLSAKFGKDWPSYLPAVTFAYNASVCASTDHTPYELIYGGRKPDLLQDLNLNIFKTESAGTPDYQNFQRKAVDTLKEAYKAVRLQQEKISRQNRAYINARHGVGRKLVEHNIGDLVLYWEPAQPKTMQTALQRLTNVVATKAPKKWKTNWTGPHEITGKTPNQTGFHYVFYHRQRGIEMTTHVNKLSLFEPWSEGIMSTSADIDGKTLYKSGSWVPDGALVVVPLLAPYPFGIAKLLSCDPDGDMVLQWLGNSRDAPHGTFELGWLETAKRRSGAARRRATTHVHYADAPRRGSVPYTTKSDDLCMNQRDVLIHGFELTSGGRLPAPLLRAIARHPYVWWDPLNCEGALD